MTTETLGSARPAAADAPVKPGLAQVVRQLVSAIGRLGPGELAQLRRGEPTDPARPAFWRLLFAVVEPAGLVAAAEGDRRDADEKAWSVLCWAIATVGADQANGYGLGRALRRAGVSELRFARLLNGSPEQLPDLIRGVVGQLASKGEPLAATDLARLLGLGGASQDSEGVRRDIARDYFAQDRRMG